MGLFDLMNVIEVQEIVEGLKIRKIWWRVESVKNLQFVHYFSFSSAGL